MPNFISFPSGTELRTYSERFFVAIFKNFDKPTLKNEVLKMRNQAQSTFFLIIRFKVIWLPVTG